MTISSWDAAYYLSALLDIGIDESAEIAKELVPDDYHTDLCVFVAYASKGLDKKSLLTGAMLTSIIMDKIRFIPGGDDEVVTCVICGNHKPVPASPGDEFGWVCSDCECIHESLRAMDRMRAIMRDEDKLERTYEN